ncbi:hypothetical protein BC628DRAFT_687086 [Trametes gibbosa]|nr:hypothetical protein BC628DRAFT_687086 [Trametes gibbosa]
MGRARTATALAGLLGAMSTYAAALRLRLCPVSGRMALRAVAFPSLHKFVCAMCVVSAGGEDCCGASAGPCWGLARIRTNLVAHILYTTSSGSASVREITWSIYLWSRARAGACALPSAFSPRRMRNLCGGSRGLRARARVLVRHFDEQMAGRRHV